MRRERHVASYIRIVKVNLIAIRVHPILKLAQIIIQFIRIQDIVGINLFRIRNEQSLNDFTSIRINKLDVPIFVLQVDHAIHMIAISLVLDDVPAHCGCLIETDVHQIGNLSRRGSCEDIFIDVTIDIVRSRHGSGYHISPRVFFKSRNINGSGSDRVILICHAEAACICLANEELRACFIFTQLSP